MSSDSGSVVVRIGVDGSVRRVPLVADVSGSHGALLRELIGCRVFDVVGLDERLDMWVDDESLCKIDLRDRAAVSAAVNRLATLIAAQYGELVQPIFGDVVLSGRAGAETTGLTSAQLDVLARTVGGCTAAS